MNVAEFDYELPAELIAQQPLARRDGSRLLVLDRSTEAIAHRRFDELPELLRPGDLLVLNDTRVIPARLVGRKESGGRVELLLAECERDEGQASTWQCLIRSSRRPRGGSRVDLGGGLEATILEPAGECWRVRLESSCDPVDAALERIGGVPLPPYIRRDGGGSCASDRERYQTVYARHPGAVAAPTAGLHFTSSLLARLDEAGTKRSFLTLHVGLGTFLPIRVERVEEHRMHSERFRIGEEVAEAIDATRRGEGRVIAVGTTVVRALEAAAEPGGRVRPGDGRCDLFIHPGYEFQVVDGMITNFHLPRSTLLMLVAAFAGQETILDAYREAVRRGYRFYSYGDAMLIGEA